MKYIPIEKMSKKEKRKLDNERRRTWGPLNPITRQSSNKIEALISNCHECGYLQKLTGNALKTGKSKILILGESPAKDGWIITGKAFYSKDGNLQATGKILQRLLDLIGLSIEDINFTEVCKCVIDDRKKLRVCSNNCKSILFKQVEEIDCDYILTMGLIPTETVLGYKIKKLKDVVGKKFEIEFGESLKTVIPIYHTSPANPLCYIGNEPIFNELKKYFIK